MVNNSSDLSGFVYVPEPELTDDLVLDIRARPDPGWSEFTTLGDIGDFFFATAGGPFLPLNGGGAVTNSTTSFTKIVTGTVSSFPPALTVNYKNQATGGVPSTFLAPAFEVNAQSYPGAVGNVTGVLAQLTSGGTGLLGNQDVCIAASVTKPGGAVSVPFGLWVPVRDTSGLDGDNISHATRGGIVGMEMDYFCNGPDNPATTVDPEFGSRVFIHLGVASYKAPAWTADTTYALNVAIQPPLAPIWIAITAYALNAVVRPNPTNGFTYVCTVSGTSSTTQPTWPTKAGTVTDGSVTWEWIGTANNGYTYVCTVPGTSGATPPVWPLSTGTVTDGTVTWKWGTTMAPQLGRAIDINTHAADGVTMGSALLANINCYDAILELSHSTLVDGGVNSAAIRIGANQPIDFTGDLTGPTQNNHTLRFINTDARHRLSYQTVGHEALIIDESGNVDLGDGSQGQILRLNAANSTSRQLQFMNTTVLRWALITGTVGTTTDNFALVRYDDSGAQLGVAMSVDRTSGQTVFPSGVTIMATNGPSWTSGAGSPSGVVTAQQSSLFSRTDGGVGTSLYVCQGGTVWNAVAGV